MNYHHHHHFVPKVEHKPSLRERIVNIFSRKRYYRDNSGRAYSASNSSFKASINRFLNAYVTQINQRPVHVSDVLLVFALLSAAGISCYYLIKSSIVPEPPVEKHEQAIVIPEVPKEQWDYIKYFEQARTKPTPGVGQPEGQATPVTPSNNSTDEVLKSIAKAVDLNEYETLETLNNDSFQEQVNEEHALLTEDNLENPEQVVNVPIYTCIRYKTQDSANKMLKRLKSDKLIANEVSVVFDGLTYNVQILKELTKAQVDQINSVYKLKCTKQEP